MLTSLLYVRFRTNLTHWKGCRRAISANQTRENDYGSGRYDNSSICPQERSLPATHLVPAANGVGYGYIATADGDVFFDYAAVKNLRLDQLTEGMTVEYALDQAPSCRYRRMWTIVADLESSSGRSTELAV